MAETDLGFRNLNEVEVFDITKKYSTAEKQPKVKDIYLAGEGLKGFTEEGVTVSEPLIFEAKLVNKNLIFTGETKLTSKPELSSDFLSLEKYNINEGRLVNVKTNYPERVIIKDIDNVKLLESKSIEFQRNFPKKIANPTEYFNKEFDIFKSPEPELKINKVVELKPTKRPEFKKEVLTDELLTKGDVGNVKLVSQKEVITDNLLSVKKVQPTSVNVIETSNVVTSGGLISSNVLSKPSLFINEEEQTNKPIIDISKANKGEIISIKSVYEKPVIDFKSVSDRKNVLDIGRVSDRVPVTEFSPARDISPVLDITNVQEPMQEQQSLFENNIIDIFSREEVVKEKEIIPKLLIPLFNKQEKSYSKSKKFKLLVRKKGKFQVRKEGLDVGDLFQSGKNILKSGAEASFKIIGEGGEVVTPMFSSDEFKPSKREKGVIVQQRSYRISSIGEKIDITYKGIEANRKGGVGFGL